VHPEPATEPLERLLVRTGHALQRVTRRAVATHDLSTTGLEVLRALVEHDGPSHRDLAGSLRLAPATLTPVLDALEAAGALTRTRDHADRRIVRVSITEGGRRRYAAAVQAVRRDTGRLPRASAQDAAIIRAHLLALLEAADRAEL
jgi:DNA-binding MarR family transcriptional regulator